jgi:hypothetical protein
MFFNSQNMEQKLIQDLTPVEGEILKSENDKKIQEINNLSPSQGQQGSKIIVSNENLTETKSFPNIIVDSDVKGNDSDDDNNHNLSILANKQNNLGKLIFKKINLILLFASF